MFSRHADITAVIFSVWGLENAVVQSSLKHSVADVPIRGQRPHGREEVQFLIGIYNREQRPYCVL
jgi:hypothetical protein